MGVYGGGKMLIQDQNQEYMKPAAAGVDPRAIARWIDRLEEEKIGIHAFQIRRHGRILAEAAYEPFLPDGRHVMYSLSKSFTSTAIGFAVQEGLLTVEDKLVDFFTDLLPAKPCPNMERITIRNLLSMNTGHQEEPWIFREEPNWSYFFLTSYVPHEPGTHFLYNTAATYMLSAILTRVTGQTCNDYLKPRLYEPLGFKSNPWWEISPEGYSAGGFGLNLSVRDIGLFARFCLQEGEWEGRQLLPKAWFKEASHPWSDNSGGTYNPENEWGQGYGYQFWLCSPEAVYRGDGACGQFAIMMPRQDMSIAITSGTSDMGGILKAIWEEILPAVSDEALVESDDLSTAQVELEDKLEHLRLWIPELPGSEAKLEEVLDLVEYKLVLDLSDNDRGVKKIRFSEDYLELQMDGAGWSRLPLDASCWTVANLDIAGDETLDKDQEKIGSRRVRSTSPAFPSELSILLNPRRDENGRLMLVLDLVFTGTPLHERWCLYPSGQYAEIKMARVSGFGESATRVFAIPGSSN